MIQNVMVYNSFLKTFQKKDVAIENDCFYLIADEIKKPVKTIDGAGKYMIPGLIDCHMHIESSMTSPERFSEAVLPLGTTTIIADPHEMANVFGLAGMQAFMDVETTLDIFYAIPSSVPSTREDLETTGGRIDVADVRQLAQDDRVICFGEVMNFPDLVSNEDTKTKQLLKTFRQYRPVAPIEGHCPIASGEDLARFIGAGVTSDHTLQTPASIREEICNGMFLQLQGKSISPENVKAVLTDDLYQYCALVTDDIMPDDFVETGQLNAIIQAAIACGMPTAIAIYCATYTPAQRMQLFDRGVIAPGKLADFILFESEAALKAWEIDAVYKNGCCVHTENAPFSEPNHAYPTAFFTSIVRHPVVANDFVLTANGSAVDIHYMVKNEKTSYTEHQQKKVPIENGRVQYGDLNIIAAVERYGKQAPIKLGLLAGGLQKRGAVASSWAHDHHNILTFGTDEHDIALAVNTVIAMQGGIVVVADGTVVATCALPLGGIVSLKPMTELAEEVKAVREALQALGYVNKNEIMSLATLSLLVSPQLKISDKGMVDVATQEIIPVIGAIYEDID